MEEIMMKKNCITSDLKFPAQSSELLIHNTL